MQVANRVKNFLYRMSMLYCIIMLVYFYLQKSEALDNSLDGLDVVNLWVGGDESTNAQNLGFSGCIKVRWKQMYFRNCYYYKYKYKKRNDDKF